MRDALEKSLAGVRTLRLGRELFTERLQRMAFRAFAERHDPSVDEADFLRELRSTGSLTAARNRIWPSINPAQVVKELLSGGPLLRSAAPGILEENEVKLLASGRRKRSGRARGRAPIFHCSTRRRRGLWDHRSSTVT